MEKRLDFTRFDAEKRSALKTAVGYIADFMKSNFYDDTRMQMYFLNADGNLIDELPAIPDWVRGRVLSVVGIDHHKDIDIIYAVLDDGSDDIKVNLFALGVENIVSIAKFIENNADEIIDGNLE